MLHDKVLKQIATYQPGSKYLLTNGRIRELSHEWPSIYFLPEATPEDIGRSHIDNIRLLQKALLIFSEEKRLPEKSMRGKGIVDDMHEMQPMVI